MSNSWLNAAMSECRTKNGARLMLFVLADRADENGVSYYGITALSEKTNLAERAAHYAITELVKLGLLSVQYKKGPKGCNVYTLQNLHSANNAQCKKEQGTLQIMQPDPAISAPNPSGIHQEPSISSSPKAAAAKFLATAVEEIYQAYPRKKAPAEAKKAITKHLSVIAKRGTPDPTVWLLGQVKAFAKTRIGEDEKYTPYPASWFNAGSYDEDIQAAPTRLGSMNGHTSLGHVKPLPSSKDLYPATK